VSGALRAPRPVRRALVFAAVLLVLHTAGARGLDALDVADRLLAGGAASPIAALLVVVLLGVRLLLVFAAPAVVVGALVCARRDQPCVISANAAACSARPVPGC
jgi:hypothetical protein